MKGFIPPEVTKEDIRQSLTDDDYIGVPYI